MSILNKRNILIAFLCVVLVGAVYLNSVLFDTKAQVSEDDNPINAELVNSYAEQEVMEANKPIGDDYFTSYRTQREKTRSADIETLQSVTASASPDDDSVKTARDELVSLVKLSEQELLLENMIKGKGFEDCVVFIHSGYVNVLVKGDELSSSQAVQIQDVVGSECGVERSKITVALAKIK